MKKITATYCASFVEKDRPDNYINKIRNALSYYHFFIITNYTTDYYIMIVGVFNYHLSITKR